MKNATKRLLAILLTASMAFSLTACGGKNDGGDAGNGDGAAVSSAPKALTEDEYKASFEEIFSDFQNVNSVDMTDIDAAKKTLEDMKTGMNEFIALNPPESCKDGHDKLSSGCQAMIDYIDTALGIIGETDQDKINDASTKMMESIQTAMTDMTEGATMLDEVFNK